MECLVLLFPVLALIIGAVGWRVGLVAAGENMGEGVCVRACMCVCVTVCVCVNVCVLALIIGAVGWVVRLVNVWKHWMNCGGRGIRCGERGTGKVCVRSALERTGCLGGGGDTVWSFRTHAQMHVRAQHTQPHTHVQAHTQEHARIAHSQVVGDVGAVVVLLVHDLREKEVGVNTCWRKMCTHYTGS